MCEAKDEVECHVIGIVEPRENAKVGYVSDIHDKTCNGPWFESSMGR